MARTPEQEYYSDRLREKQIAECEWHPGNPENDCPDCQALYDEYQENCMDMMREER